MPPQRWSSHPTALPSGVEQVDATLRARRAAWPSGAGQVAQPGRQESSPNFQHVLFACVKVGRRLIVWQLHKALTASVADASICSRRAVSNGVLRSGPPCFLRGGPLLRWPQPTRPTCPPGSPRDDFRVHPIIPTSLTCDGPAVIIPTAVLQTNATGDAEADAVFTTDQVIQTGLRGTTVSAFWEVTVGGTAANGGTVVYRTACAQITLD